MDNLKLYRKSKSEIKGLVSIVEVFRQDIGMKFSIMNREKVTSTDRIELPGGQKIRKIEDGYNTWGNWSMAEQKNNKMKDKFRNEYFRKTKLILKGKVNKRNKIMALNTWAVSIMRYGAGILNWNKNELQE